MSHSANHILSDLIKRVLLESNSAIQSPKSYKSTEIKGKSTADVKRYIGDVSRTGLRCTRFENKHSVNPTVTKHGYF